MNNGTPFSLPRRCGLHVCPVNLSCLDYHLLCILRLSFECHVSLLLRAAVSKENLSALRELHGAEPDGSLVIIMRPNGKLIKMARRAGVVHDVIQQRTHNRYCTSPVNLFDQLVELTRYSCVVT